MIVAVAARTPVEYWLISQYRPIGRASPRKSDLYGYLPAEFTSAINAVRLSLPRIEVYAQPTRSPEDPYPFRVWVLGDGTVTADLGSVAVPRNATLGNLLRDGFEPLVRHAFALRQGSMGEAA